MTEALIAAIVLTALALLGIALEMEYVPTAPSYANHPESTFTSSVPGITYSVRYGPANCSAVMTMRYQISVEAALDPVCKSSTPIRARKPSRPCPRGHHHFSQGWQMGMIRIGQRCDCGQMEITRTSEGGCIEETRPVQTLSTSSGSEKS